jgi:hypothetical protein
MTEQEQVQVTQADRDAVDAFHAAQLKRIFAGDKTLGENRDAIEQAFARHRITATAEALEAMREAREALREYACHGGPDVPCLRNESQCRADCGKPAGDAFITLTAAIAKIEGEQP